MFLFSLIRRHVLERRKFDNYVGMRCNNSTTTSMDYYLTSEQIYRQSLFVRILTELEILDIFE